MVEKNSISKIGFIGLGLMGSRIANRMIDAGCDLLVYNRSHIKAVPLLEKGATWCNSPALVGEKADIVFTMLTDPVAVEQIALGSNGSLGAMKSNSLWVDLSTVNPSFSRRMAEHANKLGIEFLDSPVSGSIGPAERGELTILVGGKEVNFNTALPYLKIFGKKIIHAGGTGMGSSLKLVINLMLGQSMLALSESLLFGEKLGIPQNLLLDTLLGGPVTAPLMSAKRNKIETEDFSPEFPLQHMAKDLRLIIESAQSLGIEMPSATITNQLYTKAVNNGFGELDLSAILASLKN